MATATCARCGTEIRPGNVYCRKCHGWAESVKSLLETAEADAALLAKAQDSSLADIAREQGVSRQAVKQRLDKARARQAQREASPAPV